MHPDTCTRTYCVMSSSFYRSVNTPPDKYSNPVTLGKKQREENQATRPNAFLSKGRLEGKEEGKEEGGREEGKRMRRREEAGSKRGKREGEREERMKRGGGGREM